ncbi:MAG TPA: class I SAM-dependent methyltransferase [Xanthobacteraceae bacterium]|nr:class I SAM-dependent methyltransferase [Xanthobacteraceae bacterium]
MLRPSRTAEYMALFRALESARRRDARLFSDPWAKRFLRPSLRIAAAAACLPPVNSAISAFIDQRWPGARPSGIARTRYIDEALTDALQDGLDQVVILGAGFDSRAYRIPGIVRARVFEVDRPATSRIKQAVLRRTLGTLPSHVTYIAVDFNRNSLAQALGAVAIDLDRPIFFLWEGVTNYLTEHAVDATLRYAATAVGRSRILFTYVDRDVLRPRGTFRGTAAVRDLLREVGEPWTFGFAPAELPHYLDARQLRLISDVDSLTYRARYMGRQGRHLIGYEFYRIAVAEVMDHHSTPVDGTARWQGELHAQG